MLRVKLIKRIINCFADWDDGDNDDINIQSTDTSVMCIPEKKKDFYRRNTYFQQQRQINILFYNTATLIDTNLKFLKQYFDLNRFEISYTRHIER